MKKGSYTMSTDKSQLDMDVIYQYLSLESYWAKGRSKDTILKSIHHSMCFGVSSPEGQQVGFARVLSDFAVLA